MEAEEIKNVVDKQSLDDVAEWYNTKKSQGEQIKMIDFGKAGICVGLSNVNLQSTE